MGRLLAKPVSVISKDGRSKTRSRNMSAPRKRQFGFQPLGETMFSFSLMAIFLLGLLLLGVPLARAYGMGWVLLAFVAAFPAAFLLGAIVGQFLSSYNESWWPGVAFLSLIFLTVFAITKIDSEARKEFASVAAFIGQIKQDIEKRCAKGELKAGTVNIQPSPSISKSSLTIEKNGSWKATVVLTPASFSDLVRLYQFYEREGELNFAGKCLNGTSTWQIDSIKGLQNPEKYFFAKTKN